MSGHSGSLIPSQTDNRPLDQIYAEEGALYVEDDARASIMERTRSAHLSQKISELGDIPYNRAEATVKRSSWWFEYNEKMVEARRLANHRKVKMESIRMAYGIWQSDAANERAQARL